MTPSFFDVIGVRPALGRAFGDAEARADERVAVISHALWTDRFGGRPDVVGSSILLDGVAWRVLGVMPASFAFPRGIDVWRPFDLTRARPGTWYLGAVARLEPGVTVETAQRDLDRLAAELSRANPKGRNGRGFLAVTIRDDLAYRAGNGVRLLQGIVALVLLIACANVANLLLAQGGSGAANWSSRGASAPRAAGSSGSC